jgi:hypothetical protein
MNQKIKFIVLLFLPLLMIGCSNNESPISFLRDVNTELTEEEMENYPVYYTVDTDVETVSVLNSVGEDFQDYDLQEFSETDEEIVFTYDSKTVTLQKETPNKYIDDIGNGYQVILR